MIYVRINLYHPKGIQYDIKYHDISFDIQLPEIEFCWSCITDSWYFWNTVDKLSYEQSSISKSLLKFKVIK